MADQTVTITYQAYVAGLDKIEDLAKKNKELQDSTEQYKKKLNDTNEVIKKHDTALGNARKSILNFRKELFAITFTAGAVIGALKALSTQSHSLGAIMETSTDAVKSWANSVGDATAYAINFLGALSALKNVQASMNFAQGQQGVVPRGIQIQEFAIRSQIAELAGDKEQSLLLKQEAERLKLKDIGDKKFLAKMESFYEQKHRLERENMEKSNQIENLGLQSQIAELSGNRERALLLTQQAELIRATQNASGERLKILNSFYYKKHQLELEDLRLTELGLQRQSEILKNFRKDLVTGLQSDTGDILFKMFEGQKQSFQAIITSIRSTLHRALADALSKSLFTSLLGGQSGGMFEGLKNLFGGGQKSSALDPLKLEAASNARRQDAILRENQRIATFSQNIDQKIQSLSAIARNIADCVCRTAGNTAGMLAGSGMNSGPTSVMIEPGSAGGGGWLSAIGHITNLGTSLIGKYGSVGGGGGDDLGGANISMGSGAFMPLASTLHSGGFVGKFANGGEVPALVQPGEFIVRKAVAQDNKEMLRNLNAGNDVRNGGAPNVFLIKANDAQSFVDMLSSPSSRNQIEIQLIRSIMNNGEVRRVIKNFAK